MNRSPDHPPRVYLVGAGPGDPGLLTVRARDLLQAADCVIYDALANPRLLDHARPGAERIAAGKRASAHLLKQDQINQLMVERARAGQTVVRLKGGDPYVFGRGSEEAIYLGQQGIDVEIVPGVPAAVAAPAYAGIPVTHRHTATSVTFITAHEDPAKDESQIDYAALAQLAGRGGTLCFYMGMSRLPRIVDELSDHGLAGQTPAAIVQWGTLPRQQTCRAKLEDLVEAAAAADLAPPAVIVIGAVAGLDSRGLLRFYEHKPLFGRRVAITRPRDQASALRQKLEEAGADVLEAAAIEITPTPDFSAVDEALKNVRRYDWLVLTSANGVQGLKRRLAALDHDARHLGDVKIAAIGDATARALGEMNLKADLVPERFLATALADALLQVAGPELKGRRFLLLRADIANPQLPQTLRDAGGEVDDVPIYCTRPRTALAEEARHALSKGAVDWITFTSSSTARSFVELIAADNGLIQGAKLASIGPVTSATMKQLGLAITAEASPHDVDGLVEAICRFERRGSA